MAQPVTPFSSVAIDASADAALDAQKGLFLSKISHELRTPLNSILGFSEILASELYGPLGSTQYKEYPEIIHGSGRKLLKLVNQVLEIARLEGRSVDFAPAPEPLEMALDDVIASLGSELAARSITVDIRNRGELPTLLADARGLRMVLTNLLQNAATFSPEGGIVRVSTRSRAGEIDICIEDEGPGIERSKISWLTDIFRQGETLLTLRTEGARLGLPICELTCQAMSGRIHLGSPPGRGLTLMVTLPRA